MNAPAEAPSVLTVDMVRCDGHGICALLAGGLIRLDEWGYPLIDPTPTADRKLRRAARRAVRACPRQALSVIAAPAASAPTPAHAHTVGT